MSSGIKIAQESPRQRDVAGLIEQLDAYVGRLYPAESNHLLSLEELCRPEIRFFVARSDTQALGCGALRLDPSGYGEIKRMYVRPEARGRRLGRLILLRLEEEARQAGLTCLRLETGIHQEEALGLYRASGYRERSPFGEYRSDPLSIFMEKPL